MSWLPWLPVLHFLCGPTFCIVFIDHLATALFRTLGKMIQQYNPVQDKAHTLEGRAIGQNSPISTLCGEHL